MYDIVNEFVNRYLDWIVIFDMFFFIGINESVIFVNFVG